MSTMIRMTTTVPIPIYTGIPLSMAAPARWLRTVRWSQGQPGGWPRIWLPRGSDPKRGHPQRPGEVRTGPAVLQRAQAGPGGRVIAHCPGTARTNGWR